MIGIFMQAGFRNAELLILVPIVALMGTAALRRLEQRRTKLLAILQGGSARVGSGRAWHVIAPVLLVAMLTSAGARPFRGYRDITVPTRGGDVMIVLDISLSMQAADAAPSRLDAAKRKIVDIVDWVSVHQTGTRIGIVLFAGTAHVYCPLTADYEIVRQFTQSIQTSFISSGGSGLSAALRQSFRSLAESGSAYPAIVLLSDGEDSAFNADEIPKGPTGVTPRLLALGLGSVQGVPIPTEGGRYVRDKTGNIVISRLNETSLEGIARAFHGSYHTALATDEDFAPFLAGALREHDMTAAGQQGSEATPHSVRVYDEIGPLLCLFSLLGLIPLIVARKSSIFLCVALATMVSPLVVRPTYAEDISPATSSDMTAREAYRAYLSGDFETAYRGFQTARQHDPENVDLLQGQASAAFRLQRFLEADKLFRELSSKSPRPQQRFEALYNRGNALLGAQKYEDAIKSYNDALSLRADDIPAQANKALAEKLLEQKKQQQQKQQQNQDKDKDKDKDKQEDKNQQQQQNQEQQQNQQQQQQEQQQSENQQSQQQESNGDEQDQDKQSQQQSPEATKSPEESHDESPSASPSPSKTESASESTPSSDSSDQSSSDQHTPTNAPDTPAQVPQPSGSPPPDQPNDSTSSEPSAATPPPASPHEGTADGEGASPMETPLVASEAQRWLDSLPEAPVLLRRFQDRKQTPSPQEW